MKIYIWCVFVEKGLVYQYIYVSFLKRISILTKDA